ncbi:MAG: ABC transporter permease [Pseudomonadota bacterium]
MLSLSDFKYALRLLLKQPKFSLLIVSVVTAGIAMSVFLFSFLNALAYKALPFEDGDEIVVFDRTINGVWNQGGDLDILDAMEIRNALEGFREFTLYDETIGNVSGRDGAQQFTMIRAEPQIFEFTRVEPVLGRRFTQAEDQRGAEAVAVISHDLWQSRFGGSERVIDEVITLNSRQTRIVGVMPEGYYFPSAADIWVPMQADTRVARGQGNSANLLARLVPGTDAGQATRQLNVIMERLADRYPNTNEGVGAYFTSLPMSILGQDAGPFLKALQVAGVFLLVLAAVNAGNLLFARALERSKEIAIRIAIGAPQRRLVMQFMWESITITAVAGVLALAIVALGLEGAERATASFVEGKPAFWWQMGVDAYTVSILTSFVVGTILVTGLLPALKSTTTNVGDALKDGTRGALGKREGVLAKLFVVSQILLSSALLIASGIMVVGTWKATQANYGAETDQFYTARIRLPDNTYLDGEKRINFVNRLQQELEYAEGIGKVAVMSELPGVYTWRTSMAIEGRVYDQSNSYPRINYVSVTPESLSNIGVDLRSGRYFNSSDKQVDGRTAIVTTSFVEQYLPDEDPIGSRLRIVDVDGDQVNWVTIVGVVEHTIQGEPFSSIARSATVFRPYSQQTREGLFVALENVSSKATVVKSMRAVVNRLDPEIAPFSIRSYRELIQQNTAKVGFVSEVFLILGGVAGLLAACGIFGVLSNAIIRKTQQIGVKQALGATDAAVYKESLASGIFQMLWGLVPGVAVGAFIGFSLGGLLNTGLSALVSISALVVTSVLVAVVLSVWVPVRKILQRVPADLLRYE